MNVEDKEQYQQFGLWLANPDNAITEECLAWLLAMSNVSLFGVTNILSSTLTVVPFAENELADEGP